MSTNSARNSLVAARRNELGTPPGSGNKDGLKRRNAIRIPKAKNPKRHTDDDVASPIRGRPYIFTIYVISALMIVAIWAFCFLIIHPRNNRSTMVALILITIMVVGVAAIVLFNIRYEHRGQNSGTHANGASSDDYLHAFNLAEHV